MFRESNFPTQTRLKGLFGIPEITGDVRMVVDPLLFSSNKTNAGVNLSVEIDVYLLYTIAVKYLLLRIFTTKGSSYGG
jgi:hypothetical protein